MSISNLFALPFLLGFESTQKILEHAYRTGEPHKYPPYNITERDKKTLRISLAIAGFTKEELCVIHQQYCLIIKGQKARKNERNYLHQGIATRQFQHHFFLAEGLQVQQAFLCKGLLHVDLTKPSPSGKIKEIAIIEH